VRESARKRAREKGCNGEKKKAKRRNFEETKRVRERE